MRSVPALLFFLVFQVVIAQETKVKQPLKAADRYEKTQGKDFSVPPPPTNIFPAHYGEGNRKFLEKVKQNLDVEKLTVLPKNLKTTLIIKIDAEGNVLNISTYGNDEDFDHEVQNAAVKANGSEKWEAGQNKQGRKVIDVIRIPFSYKRP